MTEIPTPLPPGVAVEPVVPTRACQNCSEPLLGDHCYACGQPVKGLVRHFSSIVGDFFDTVLNIDSRVFRTLWPLLAKPGYLSREYFAGRRVRYVSPVRLFFFLSIVTFFIAQLTFDFGNHFNFGDGKDSIDKAQTVAEVERVRDQVLADLAEARAEIPDTPGARAGMDAGMAVVRTQAANRIAELQGAAAKGMPPPVPAKDDGDVDFTLLNDEPWDAKANPVVVAWLPGFANAWLNAQVGHAKDNIKRFQQDPNLFKDAVLSAVPSTLFVLLPVFALMLKLAYALKRRLYMEHLIVALHSHAFLCLALLLQFTLAALEGRLAAGTGFVRSVFNLLQAALWVWMLLYLLLMQKRVYAQGWPMTLLKFSLLGICYFTLLTFGAVFTMLASLVWT